MRYLKRMAIVLVALAVLFLVVGFFLPPNFTVARTAEIAAPPEKVYALVADPRGWKQWSAWNKRDPQMQIEYGGPPAGMGAKWSWKSKSEGAGSMEFVRVEPNKRIEYALAFPEFNMKSGGAFAIDAAPSGTKVTWTNAGDVGTNPLKHYLAWGMDRLVGPDFEQGLANLKSVAEKP